MWVSLAGGWRGHCQAMRVHVPVGVLEDTDGYLHAAQERWSGPIALCGAGHISEPWPGDFDTDDPRSCPTCVAILSEPPPTPRPRTGHD